MISPFRVLEASILLEAYRAVYIEVPKVACSSIKVALAGLLGIDLEVVGGNPHKVRFPAPASLPGASGVLYPHLFSFAFLRNPWACLVSCYRDKVLGKVSDFPSFDAERGVAHCLARFDAFRSGMSFDDFVTAVAAIPDEEADGHFRAQHTFVANPHGDTAVDFIGRYETLARDFRAVRDQLGLPILELPHVQVARTPVRYADYYTSRTRQTVASRFWKDVELFGYEFGSK